MAKALYCMSSAAKLQLGMVIDRKIELLLVLSNVMQKSCSAPYCKGKSQREERSSSLLHPIAYPCNTKPVLILQRTTNFCISMWISVRSKWISANIRKNSEEQWILYQNYKAILYMFIEGFIDKRRDFDIGFCNVSFQIISSVSEQQLLNSVKISKPSMCLLHSIFDFCN